MKRYIALLRGINISGKNKIPMSELKKEFENLTYDNVKTYLNSGNVILSTEEIDTIKLTNQFEKMIYDKFDLKIPVFVISKNNLEEILDNAPDWWDDENKEIYDNLIFIFPSTNFSDVYNEIGEPKNQLEKIKNYKEVIFWSFIRKDYRKTNWWSKTANAKISNKLTIRTANSIKKVVNM